MLIDWFTVGAQALNFVILVWLLKRFLYKPILDAIDKRETAIAAEIAAADATKADARKEHDEFQRKNADLNRQSAEILAKATDEARVERQRLIDEARQAADALATSRQEKLSADARSLNQSIRARAQQEVFAIARKTLTDLASVDLEQRVCDVFAARLSGLSGDARNELAAALQASGEPALVRTAFDLSTQQQGVIRNALNVAFSADVRVRFETAPDLVSGIELTVKGRKLAWSIADYLASLQQGIDDLLKAELTPPAKSIPEPSALHA